MNEKNTAILQPTALITGASSGIGAALAEVFARHGHGLVLTARDAGRLEELAARLRRDHAVTADVLPADLAQESSPQDLFDEIGMRSIEVGILVNNAGMIVYGEFSKTDLAEELRMVQVNLVALTRLTKLFLPGMIRRERGQILNVGSNGSFAPSPLNAVYSATKAYILSFSEAIAEELDGTGVTVTALCPGATRSELQGRAGMEGIPLLERGVMEAMDVAQAGYEGLMAGRQVVVPGFRTRFEVFLVRILPRRAVVRYAHNMLRRKP